MNKFVAVVIPAYKPTSSLLQTVGDLANNPLFSRIVVVDDGSGPEFAKLFSQVRGIAKTKVLRHFVNLGKGAALKTGLNYIACEYPSAVGAVTADADGQHATLDILNVARRLMEQPQSLVLGVREFGEAVPLRSRLGNLITRQVLRAVGGLNLRDTQTGLRGIPLSFFAELLRIDSDGYEYELDMLLACKASGRRISEVGIRTIYLDGNASSHFDPIFDSMRIYFVLLRFMASSLLAALVDNVVFASLFAMGGSIAMSQIGGRIFGTAANYLVNKRGVFQSKAPHGVILPKYILLVAISGVLSYSLILLFTDALGMGVIAAKLVAESILFFFNFIYQRDLVFKVQCEQQHHA